MTRGTFYSVKDRHSGAHCGHRHRSYKGAAECARRLHRHTTYDTSKGERPYEVVIVGGVYEQSQLEGFEADG